MQKALQFAIRSVTRKRQTEEEMRKKLKKRFPDEDHEAVIERLKELDYLNDREFSAAWVRYRSLSSARGKYALQQELRRKGIKDEDMTNALEKFDEGDVLEDLARKRWEKLNDENFWKRREKLQRFLLSRGFAISRVLDIINSVAKKEDDC